MFKTNQKKLKGFFLLIGLIFAGAFAGQDVHAATSYFSPSSGNFTVGNIFTINVLVNTEGVAINTVEAIINYPNDLLEIVSISKSGSIFSLWVEEPTFSNNAGTLSFNGGLPTPGFNGSAGKVLGVVFRVKKSGTASLIFSSVAIRANDGLGTNVFRAGAQASFNLVSEVKPPEPEVKPPTPEVKPPVLEEKPPVPEAPVEDNVPTVPQISSPTHQDSNKWYNNKNPRFSWTLSSDITGVSTYFSQSPTSNPGRVSDGLITSKSYENVADGIWYFHIRFRNKYGWSETTHRKVLIDTERPQLFEITIDNGGDPTNPTPILYFKAIDTISGLEYYEIKIGEQEDVIPVKATATVISNPYKLPILSSGKHTIIIKAVDGAGNETLSAIDVVIEPLESPIITDYPKQLPSDELLIIKGLTRYPNALTTIWFEYEGEEAKSQSVRNDTNGNFTFLAETKLKDGIYKVWAEVADDRGAKSLYSEKVIIFVEQPAFLRIGYWTVSLLAVIIPLIALMFVLLFIIWYGWHKFASFRKKLKNLRKEVHEAESVLHKAFDMLKQDIHDQVKLLEKTKSKRQLTHEEEKIIKQLSKDLDSAEKLVRKEIEDIEKIVK